MYDQFGDTILYIGKRYKVKRDYRTRDHYRGLGYPVDEKEYFFVRPEHLSKGADKNVVVICPICREEREIEQYHLMRGGHSRCKGCAKIKNIRGERIGRLLPLSVVGKDPFGYAIWRCLCDCGNVKDISYNALGNGGTTSCGCYRVELARKMVWNAIYASYTWNNPLSEESKIRERTKGELWAWKNAVRERDDYKCQVGGCQNNRLEVHHLYSYSSEDGRGLRHDIRNGVTLCRQHHRKGKDSFHKIYGKINNTPKQFYEWIGWGKKEVVARGLLDG